MMTKICEQRDAAFSRVSAYVVARNGERVATIAFKFPVDGAGRLWAYVHWLGLEMVRGYAGGYGYDKRTAACASAMAHKDCELRLAEPGSNAEKFFMALIRDAGQHWGGALRAAGFEVWQAV
jgi:hypothetical protein